MPRPKLNLTAAYRHDDPTYFLQSSASLSEINHSLILARMPRLIVPNDWPRRRRYGEESCEDIHVIVTKKMQLNKSLFTNTSFSLQAWIHQGSLISATGLAPSSIERQLNRLLDSSSIAITENPHTRLIIPIFTCPRQLEHHDHYTRK